MKIQCLQHVPFETPGYIREVCEKAGYTINTTRLYLKESIPDADQYDLLLIMGGPMSIHDEDQYPWLVDEMKAIKSAITKGKLVFGFCLGAQLIASALHADVFSGTHTEIGWFPVKKVPGPELLGFLPDIITVFHWHGDTFNIPEGATLLYSSDATSNQAFVYGDNVLALQFHPEMTQSGIADLVQNCREELISAPYIMKEEDIIKGHSHYHFGGHKMIDAIFRYFDPEVRTR